MVTGYKEIKEKQTKKNLKANINILYVSRILYLWISGCYRQDEWKETSAHPLLSGTFIALNLF